MTDNDIVSAVIYDPETGIIRWSTQTSLGALKAKADTNPYILMDAHSVEHDQNYRVDITTKTLVKLK